MLAVSGERENVGGDDANMWGRLAVRERERAAGWVSLGCPSRVGPVWLGFSFFLFHFFFLFFDFFVCSLICLKHFYLVLVNFKFCKL
jgi:hypothetical protein